MALTAGWHHARTRTRTHAHASLYLRAQEAATRSLEARIRAMADANTRLRPSLTAAHAQLTAIRASQNVVSSEAREAVAGVTALMSDLALRFTTMLRTYSDAYAALTTRYKKELMERRRLHNLVQELRGNIRVYCRARPPLPFELEAGNSVSVAFPEVGEVTVSNMKKQCKTWEFDQVFPPATTNDTVFRETEPLIVSAMDGYNVCVFA